METKTEIRSAQTRDNPFSQWLKENLEHSNRQVRLLVRFENNNLCIFSMKNFDYYGNLLRPRRLVNPNKGIITTCSGSDFTLHTSVSLLRAITIRKTFDAVYSYNKSVINRIESVYYPNKMSSEKNCVHKKVVKHLVSTGFRCPDNPSLCHTRNVPFENQLSSFLLTSDQKEYILKCCKKLNICSRFLLSWQLSCNTKPCPFPCKKKTEWWNVLRKFTRQSMQPRSDYSIQATKD